MVSPMTNSTGKVIGRIEPGPLKGTRLVTDERDGGLTISILGEPEPPTPPATPPPPKQP